jgi:hypothetical protein
MKKPKNRLPLLPMFMFSDLSLQNGTLGDKLPVLLLQAAQLLALRGGGTSGQRIHLFENTYTVAVYWLFSYNSYNNKRTSLSINQSISFCMFHNFINFSSTVYVEVRAVTNLMCPASPKLCEFLQLLFRNTTMSLTCLTRASTSVSFSICKRLNCSLRVSTVVCRVTSSCLAAAASCVKFYLFTE